MPKVDLRTNPPLDDFVLLDASIFLAALAPVLTATGSIDHSRYSQHADARKFLQYAATQALRGSVILVTTELAIEECAHHISTAALERDIVSGQYDRVKKVYQARQSNRGRSLHFGWAQLYKERRRSIQPHTQLIKRFISQVRAIPVAILGPDDLQGATLLPESMTDNMRSYKLLAADAYHLAVAKSLGITMVASLDSDWLEAVGDFTVLTNR